MLKQIILWKLIFESIKQVKFVNNNQITWNLIDIELYNFEFCQ